MESAGSTLSIEKTESASSLQDYKKDCEVALRLKKLITSLVGRTNMLRQMHCYLGSGLVVLLVSASPNAGAAQLKEDIGRSASEISVSNGNLETYHLIQEIFNDKISSSDMKTSQLEVKLLEQEKRAKRLEFKLTEQEAQISELKRALSAPPESTGSFTTTVVLAAVTVVVTVLGVLMAILSIFGYTNIRQESIKASQETAQSTIKSIAETGLLQATENSLITLLEKGRFDEIIQNAISTIEFRGISVESDLLEEEKQR